MKLDEQWKDAVHTHFSIDVSLLDRLRILWHGKMTIHSMTPTEHLPGKTGATEVLLIIPPIIPRRPPSGGWEAVETESAVKGD